jgi:hypothetical protein
MGHLLAALALGADVDQFRVFGGRPLVVTERVTIGYLPVEGGTTVSICDPLHLIAIVAAGPIANLITASVLFPYMDNDVLAVMVNASLLLTIVALAPTRRAISDGAILWHFARGRTLAQLKVRVE